MRNRDELTQSPLPLPLCARDVRVYDAGGFLVAVATSGPGSTRVRSQLKRAQERAIAIATACNEYDALKRRVAELEAERAELHKCLRGIAVEKVALHKCLRGVADQPTTDEVVLREAARGGLIHNAYDFHNSYDLARIYNLMIREARLALKEKP